MKKYSVVVLMFFCSTTFGQREKGFFSNDSAGIKTIVTRVMENTKNNYEADKVFAHKNGIEYWFRYDLHNKIKMHFQIFPDRAAILRELTGRYEDIFPFWKKYFQLDADSATVEKTTGVKSIPISCAKGEVVYVLRKLPSPLWEIEAFSLVNPIKK